MLEMKIKLWLHEDEKTMHLKTLTLKIEILLYMIQYSGWGKINIQKVYSLHIYKQQIEIQINNTFVPN